ncbi:transposase [Pelagicoccus sp. SDUM812002]|nr:transposase [Pelagicoccus sp. SDUM812002]
MKIDFGNLEKDLGGFVRGTVEEAINGLLDAEAEQICDARHYELSNERSAHRNSHCERKLHTGAGEVKLKVPKLRGASFEALIIERCRRRESSVKESLVEVYLAGVSVRRIEDTTEALGGARESLRPSATSNQKRYECIEALRQPPLRSRYVYAFMDGLRLKRSRGGEMENVSVLVAIGVNENSFREVLGCVEGISESKDSWLDLLRNLYSRGLGKIDLTVFDKSRRVVEACPRSIRQVRGRGASSTSITTCWPRSRTAGSLLPPRCFLRQSTLRSPPRRLPARRLRSPTLSNR